LRRSGQSECFGDSQHARHGSPHTVRAGRPLSRGRGHADPEDFGKAQPARTLRAQLPIPCFRRVGNHEPRGVGPVRCQRVGADCSSADSNDGIRRDHVAGTGLIFLPAWRQSPNSHDLDDGDSLVRSTSQQVFAVRQGASCA